MEADRYQLLRDRYQSVAYARNNVLDGKFRGMMAIYSRMYGRLMPEDKGARIVDIACGAGQFIRYCLDQGYENVQGVDLSPEQVDYCETHVPGRAALMDGFHLLVGLEGKLDLVVANDFIEHITKARGIDFVELAFRALRPGGRIILKTGNMAAFGGLVIWCNGLDHECGYTERSLETLLGINGFEEIAIIPYTERRRVYNWSQRVFHSVLRLMYRYLYAGNYPRIYTKIIAATGVRA
jgi:2-polyprenyl-3-methyl-5-hydroxy-6-metoxy-1,4-benzoquinol methylase